MLLFTTYNGWVKRSTKLVVNGPIDMRLQPFGDLYPPFCDVEDHNRLLTFCNTYRYGHECEQQKGQLPQNNQYSTHRAILTDTCQG